jgi:hypothetical protein
MPRGEIYIHRFPEEESRDLEGINYVQLATVQMELPQTSEHRRRGEMNIGHELLHRGEGQLPVS